MRRDEATLLDIAKAAGLIQVFMNGTTREKFLNAPKTGSSELYQLLVIGEAVKQLSVNFRERNDEISWSLIAGMRDHLIHAYDTVDWEEVWTTVTQDVPQLQTQIMPLLPTMPDA